MRKIIFLILSVFIISNIGYSEVRNISGLSFNDEIFGKGKYCKAIGSYYLMLAVSGLTLEFLGEKHPKHIKQLNEVAIVVKAINEKLLEEGYDYSSSVGDNINYYYKNNCRIVKKGEIVADEKDYLSNRLVTHFNTMMKIFFEK